MATRERGVGEGLAVYETLRKALVVPDTGPRPSQGLLSPQPNGSGDPARLPADRGTAAT